MVFYRRGVGFLGDPSAEVRRWKREAKQAEECRASPACQFQRQMNVGLFQHCYGSYKHYLHKAIVDVDFDDIHGGPQIAYGYNVLLRLMFVMPEVRGQGIGKEILYRMKDIADETGCTITAVCVPVEWNWTRSLDDVRGSPGKERTLEEQCKYVADMFDNYESALKYLDLSRKENKEKQRRQRQRFLDCGFKRCLLKDNISKRNRQKLSHWTMAYIPDSCPQVQRDFLETRLRD